jgi:RNA polymerase sigma-70 factor (sigma-E family)
VDTNADYTAFAAARWKPLVRSAVLLGAGQQEAEDLAQVTLERCYRSWDAVRRATDLDAYVYRVLINCFTKSRKRRWWGERPVGHLPDLPAQTDHAEQTALVETVLAVLEALGPAHREVLVLRFFADLSEQQTAAALGVQPGTVKSRVARALALCAADGSLADLFNHEES